MQQRGIGNCYLLVTLSLLCKNENMNFCNNNIGEIELENGVKVPVSTITKRDDGSVIVSMYNDDGKLCRQIVTKEQLEKTTFKTADGKEVILSNGDLDVKAIEIAAIGIFGWRKNKNDEWVPEFTSGNMAKAILRLTGKNI